ERSGRDALPITVLDGQVVLAGRYPSRQQLSQWTGIGSAGVAAGASSCCSGGKCC
ncbi:MAG TPA: arsenic metallochaperone ArsD family protein, partial [Roseateles sp.]|uniref:arsenic metallochaperone ArsD family protein n=1 Tax=Roseateles sp. TaxID=1971397 RepID=UPI002ED8BAF4